jgi:RNA polymerase sigma-70 factor (ECF subfamily)
MKTFEKKLIEYIPNLRRYAIALTANSSTQADDLVQDTLERALKKRSLWMRDSNLRAWLFTIMHNVFINQITRIDANKMDDLDTIANTLLSDADPSHDYFMTQLKQQLELLSVKYKEIIFLVSLEGFSYQEVSKILDIPVGTVMSRLHRAREQLRQALFKDNTTPLRRVK